jgi:hypothetical protein
MIRASFLQQPCFVAACAAPYSIPADNRAETSARIAGYESAFSCGNTTEIIKVVPPRMGTSKVIG